jgi:hypothetical protein
MLPIKRLAALTAIVAVLRGLASAQDDGTINAVRHIAAPAPQAWQAWANPPHPMGMPMIAEANGEAFFMGGLMNQDQVTDRVFSMDVRTRAWQERARMPLVVTQAATAALNGKIYVAGGCAHADLANPVASARVYDPATDTWTPLPSLPERICAATGAALDGRFFVFGGLSGPLQGGTVTPHVYVFDPRTGAWSRGSDMPRARMASSGAPLGGRFLLVGGCQTPPGGEFCSQVYKEVDAYDPRADAWSSAPPLPVPRHAGGAIAYRGGVLFAGGRPYKYVGATNDSEETYLLRPGAATWQPGPLLLAPSYFPQLFPVGNGVALFGGPTNNPDDLIQTLDVPGPYLERRPGEKARQPEFQPAAPVAQEPPPAPTPAPESLALPPAVAPNPRAYAVVIGVERYRETLPRADFAAGDAKIAAEYFKRVLGVPEENLALLTDERATKSDFEKYFERWLPNRVEDGDKVYVYFSGHGAPNPKSGESFLVPYDADPTYIEETGYSIKRLYAQLAKLPARSVLVAMDSCFSGAGGRSVIAKGVRPLISVRRSAIPPPLTVITASSGEQVSNSYQEKGHGLFTYFFLQALKDNGADFHAVFDELKPQVTRVARREYNSTQVPELRGGE